LLPPKGSAVTPDGRYAVTAAGEQRGGGMRLVVVARRDDGRVWLGLGRVAVRPMGAG